MKDSYMERIFIIMILSQQAFLRMKQIFDCALLDITVQEYELNFLQILINLFLMSFFPQNQRKTNLQKQGSPSPCQYNPNSLSNSRRYAYAPFGSTQKLDRSINKNQKANPQKKQLQEEEQIFKDFNINIKQQQQISSVFKSQTQRFNLVAKQERPGPGQYEISKNIIPLTRSQTILNHNFPISLKPTVPSIPIDNLGFKQDENNQMKKVQAPVHDPPSAVSYDVRTNLNGKGVLMWKPEKIINKQIEKAPGPGQYNYELRGKKSLSSCFTSTTDRFGLVKKIKQQKKPGPGAYNASVLKSLSHNISNEVFFNSKTSRFDKSYTNSSLGPGSYFNQMKKSHSVNHIKRVVNKQEQIINKNSNRTTVFQSQNKNPGPGQYKTNYGISYQLHKALLKKQTTDVFPKEKRKVFESNADQAPPGPGTYDQPIKTKHKSQGKLYKKTQVVNLKHQPQYTPSPIDYANFHNTIEAKVKQMNTKLTLTEEKPFNSCAQRFKHYSNNDKNNDQQYYLQTEKTMPEQSQIDIANASEKKRVKRLVMTTIKVRVPFGISSNKYQSKQQKYYGPDFYDKEKDWTKPTFNIKGKLQ